MIASVAFFLKAFRPILILVAQCLLVFTLLPLAYGSGSSQQHIPRIELIPGPLISLSADDGPAYAIVVEKDTQTITVYEYKDAFSLKHRFPCSTGEVRGKKVKSGDRKTPEGVYFFTKAFNKRELNPVYGPRAFVIDYPNLMDRKSSRDGNNIWLHGTSKPIRPRDSNGCVAMNNDDLDTVVQYIHLNRTPIIIQKKLNMVHPESQIADYKSLIEFLEAWKTAFISGDKTRYTACYNEPPKDQDALWGTWDEIRTGWKQSQIPFGMTLKNVSFVRANPHIVALFDQAIYLDRHVKCIGTKKLFLDRDRHTWKIEGEVYQPAESNPEAIRPMVTALAWLDRLQKDYKAIAELIAEWAGAWSCKDITRYRACYAQNFHARGMDLTDWIRYKERLNKRYESIRVSAEDLQIRRRSDRCTATFLQRYHSTGHQSVGTKTLRLKRIGGAWKIYRETWHMTPK